MSGEEGCPHEMSVTSTPATACFLWLFFCVISHLFLTGQLEGDKKGCFAQLSRYWSPSETVLFDSGSKDGWRLMGKAMLLLSPAADPTVWLATFATMKSESSPLCGQTQLQSAGSNQNYRYSWQEWKKKNNGIIVQGSQFQFYLGFFPPPPSGDVTAHWGNSNQELRFVTCFTISETRGL